MWALKILHGKNWRESLHVREFHHPPKFLRILAATPGCQNDTGLPVLDRGLRFYLVLDFWLACSRGRPVLDFQHVYLTQTRDRNPSHTGLSVLWSHFRLTQMRMSWLVR